MNHAYFLLFKNILDDGDHFHYKRILNKMSSVYHRLTRRVTLFFIVQNSGHTNVWDGGSSPTVLYNFHFYIDMHE